jgi:hypothetical protein
VFQAAVLSSAGLLWAATVPRTKELATDPFTIALLVVSALVLVTRKVESVWLILAAGILKLGAWSFHLVYRLQH